MKKYYVLVLSFLFAGLISCTEEKTVNCDCETKIGSYVFYLDANNSQAKLTSATPLELVESNLTYTQDRHGKSNSAFYFNGNNSVIKLKYNPVMNLGYQFSISCWVKPDANYGTPHPETGWVELLGRWENQAVGTSTYNLNIQPSDGNVYAQICDSWNVSRTSSNKLLPVNEWTNVIYVFDRGIEALYYNGKMVNYNICSYKPQESTFDFYVGMRYNNTCQYGGALSDLYVFNRALRDYEINLLAKE